MLLETSPMERVTIDEHGQRGRGPGESQVRRGSEDVERRARRVDVESKTELAKFMRRVI